LSFVFCLLSFVFCLLSFVFCFLKLQIPALPEQEATIEYQGKRHCR